MVAWRLAHRLPHCCLPRFDRSVALLGTVAYSRVGRDCHRLELTGDWQALIAALRKLERHHAGFSVPVRGRARRRYDELASQPPRDIGTGRRATLPRLEHDPEKWEPVFRKDRARTKENDLQSELLSN